MRTALEPADDATRRPAARDDYLPGEEKDRTRAPRTLLCRGFLRQTPVQRCKYIIACTCIIIIIIVVRNTIVWPQKKILWFSTFTRRNRVWKSCGRETNLPLPSRRVPRVLCARLYCRPAVWMLFNIFKLFSPDRFLFFFSVRACERMNKYNPKTLQSFGKKLAIVTYTAGWRIITVPAVMCCAGDYFFIRHFILD